MRLVAFAGLVFASSLATRPAHADTLGGWSVTVEPQGAELDGGMVGVWGAGAWDRLYVGGEYALESYTSGASDFSQAFHGLVGVQTVLSDRLTLLTDVGVGVSQQVTWHLGIFGGESGMDTDAVKPSGALRAQLFAEIGTIRQTRMGLILTTEARSTTDADAGYGVGVGFFAAKY